MNVFRAQELPLEDKRRVFNAGEGLRREEGLYFGVEPILHEAERDEHAEPLDGDGDEQQQADGDAAQDAGAVLYQPFAECRASQ